MKHSEKKTTNSDVYYLFSVKPRTKLSLPEGGLALGRPAAFRQHAPPSFTQVQIRVLLRLEEKRVCFPYKTV